VSFIFYFIYKNTPSKILPPVEDLLVLDSCTTLVNKIKNKEVTCRHVVECFIKRIEQVNPILNAVVDTRFDKALAEADEYDKLIELADTEDKINLIFDGKPLFGIPFTSKESTAAKGMAFKLDDISGDLRFVIVDRAMYFWTHNKIELSTSIKHIYKLYPWLL